MKFATIMKNGVPGIAVSDGGAFHYLLENEPAYPGELQKLLGSGKILGDAAAAVLAGPQIDLDDVTLLPPVPNPGKILCIGLNYLDHADEVNMPVPEHPTVFTRFATTLIGHGAPIVKPAASDQLDYEAELAVVIGRGGHKIAKADALDHIAGYSIFNDVSLRDYQLRTSQWTIGKNFDATGPFGPFLVTADALPPGCAGLAISARLNGEVVQESNIDKLIFDIATIVSTLSETMTLEPGDVIITGTPAGVGMSRDPKLFMKPDDVFEVEIEGIGVLRNTVVAE